MSIVPYFEQKNICIEIFFLHHGNMFIMFICHFSQSLHIESIKENIVALNCLLHLSIQNKSMLSLMEAMGLLM